MARGWCNAHYLRWHRYGDPEAPMRRAASGSAYAWLVDAVANRDRSKCWPWPFKWANSGGYGCLYIPGQPGTRRASHVALHLDGRPQPEGAWALHSCDNPPCTNPGHLRWGTQTDNIADMLDRGRRNSAKKLTPDKVRCIRAAIVAGVRYRVIAHWFDISEPTIADIKAGRTWKEVA